MICLYRTFQIGFAVKKMSATCMRGFFMIALLLVLYTPHIDGFIGKPTIGVVQARNITGMPYSKATDNLINCVFLCSAVVDMYT